MAARWFRSALRRLLTTRGRSLEITKSGWLFIGLTLLVGFAAVNSGSNLLHALFGAQMALIIGSGVLSEAAVRRTTADRYVGATVFARTAAPVRVRLRNLSAQREVFSVSVEDDESTTDGTCVPVFAVRLAPSQALEIPTTLTMGTRGRHRLPSAVLATRFPFGLFVKRKNLEDAATVLVYPRVHPLTLDRPPGDSDRQGEGGARAARVGEFHGLREYRDGDDPRRIHWPSLARRARPLVREHESDGQTRVMLELGSGRVGEPEFEDAIERLASQVVAYLRLPGVAVGLKIAGTLAAPPASGPGAQHALLEALALAGDP